jgi:hypothetical protein
MMNIVLVVAALALSVQSSPAPGGFGSTVRDTSSACQSALAALPAALATCYGSPLYFSTPSTVCTDTCLGPTIAGAASIINACKGSETSLPNYGVYVDWANDAAAHAACAPASNNKRCLERIASSMVIADTVGDAKRQLSDDELTTLGCAEACTKHLYQTVQGDAAKAPTLYYYGNTRMNVLFGAWKRHCNWNTE